MNHTANPEKKLLGVCCWLSPVLNIDVKIIRLLFILSVVLSVGTTAVIYLILWAAREFKIL